MAMLGPYSRDQKARIDEGAVIARILAATEHDGVLVDVGAHYGSSLAHYADAGWAVLACEPDTENRRRLVERFAGRANVTIDSRAVSDERARGAAFFSSEESSGISSLHAFRESHRETDTVDVTTVADLVDIYRLSRIDFLKIDVEGLDWNVLKGVPWDRIVPDAIECEFEDAKTLGLGYTYRDIADYLVERGYAVYLSEWHPIVRYGIRHDWRQVVRYPAPLACADAWGNILAFREDPGVDALTRAFVSCIAIENPPATEADYQESASEAVVSPSASEEIALSGAIPGWMNPDDLVIMAQLARRVGPDGAIVEVGSWLGQSTYIWATNTRATIYAIDLWEWMPKAYDGPGKELVDLEGDPYTQFMNNVGHLSNVVPLRRHSSGGEWPYGFVDIVFLDAMHQNPWVGDDVRYWETLVRPGGAICGDDYADRFPDAKTEAQACAERLGVELELPGSKFWVVRKPGGQTRGGLGTPEEAQRDGA